MGANWWSQWTPPLIQYDVLLRLFVDGRITGDEFEALFLPLYLNNPGNWPDGVFELLDSLFFDVDDYTGDSELRSWVGGIDEGELRRRTAECLSALTRLAVVAA